VSGALLRFGSERAHGCNAESCQCERERDAGVYVIDERVRVASTGGLGRLVAMLGLVVIPALEVGCEDRKVGYEECRPDCYK
jgi:hypothetical protein